MSKYGTETVLDVRHWNDHLFSFPAATPVCALTTASS